jgi:hypothetical protein
VIIVKSEFIESFVDPIFCSKEFSGECSLGSTESIGNEDDYGWGSFVGFGFGRNHAWHNDYVEQGGEGRDEHRDGDGGGGVK